VTDISLKVPEVHCGHCKESIEGAVSTLEGVASVDVGIDSRIVNVSYDGSDSTLSAVVNAIEEQGYTVGE
jgi:copper chaperone